MTSEGVMDEIVATSTGVSYPAINPSALMRLRIPVHDLSTQQRIADYLDRETGEIDAMLAKLDEMESVLRERVHTIQDAALYVPEARATPIWSLFAEEKRQNHPTETILSVYRDLGVIRKDSRDDNFNRTPEDVSAYQLVNPGDLVVNKMKAWQGSLGISPERGIVSPDYSVSKPIHPHDGRFLHRLLRSQRMVPEYRIRSKGVRPAQWRLYWQDLAQVKLPIPETVEQVRIADHLDAVTDRIDLMLAKVDQLKALLIERRAALITDVVTGRKEVA